MPEVALDMERYFKRNCNSFADNVLDSFQLASEHVQSLHKPINLLIGSRMMGGTLQMLDSIGQQKVFKTAGSKLRPIVGT